MGGGGKLALLVKFLGRSGFRGHGETCQGPMTLGSAPSTSIWNVTHLSYSSILISPPRMWSCMENPKLPFITSIQLLHLIRIEICTVTLAMGSGWRIWRAAGFLQVLLTTLQRDSLGLRLLMLFFTVASLKRAMQTLGIQLIFTEFSYLTMMRYS